MSNDTVADDEVLYRGVRDLPGYVVIQGDVCRPSSQAFSDQQMQISVDRADLCGHDPNYTQVDHTDAVISFKAVDVRQVKVERQGEVERPFYDIDIKPDPLVDNPAHAVILADPEFANPSRFKRLKERLAMLYEQGKAKWEIKPPSIR